MRKRPDGDLVWRLKRHNLQEDMWDHICPVCKQTTPIFVHEHEDAQGKLIFSYLCDKCAQKMLAEWLRCTDRTDYRIFEHITDFDAAALYHQQQSGEENLVITRWTYEQRQRQLQQDKE